jgi:hypothetical protein
MKTECSLNCIRPLLLCLAVATGAGTWASAQDAVYAAHVSATTQTVWDSPFYWIDSSPRSEYGFSPQRSTVTTPVGTPARGGSNWHTPGLLSIGEGYGLVHTKGTQVDAVYEVQVTQPNYQLTTDLIMNVGSTNCDIGGVFGATADGGWTNTTAFQSAYSRNQWATVCYLTNRAGVTQPHIDFKYGSSMQIGSEHTYADCVRFHLVAAVSSGPTPARLTSIDATSIAYEGGSGTQFVLVKSSSLTVGLQDWQPVATNSATPGSFPISAGDPDSSAFYAIRSE